MSRAFFAEVLSSATRNAASSDATVPRAKATARRSISRSHLDQARPDRIPFRLSVGSAWLGISGITSACGRSPSGSFASIGSFSKKGFWAKRTGPNRRESAVLTPEGLVEDPEMPHCVNRRDELRMVLASMLLDFMGTEALNGGEHKGSVRTPVETGVRLPSAVFARTSPE